jgi:hypothetical protein
MKCTQTKEKVDYLTGYSLGIDRCNGEMIEIGLIDSNENGDIKLYQCESCKSIKLI